MAWSAGVLAVMEIAAIEGGRHRRRGEIAFMFGALLLRRLRASCAAPVPLRQTFLAGTAIVPLAARTARLIARSAGRRTARRQGTA
jgi:hypothetical protein